MTESLSATANAFLKDFAFDFKLKYASKVYGRTDGVFSSLYTALGPDNSRLSSLKAKRSQALNSIDNLMATQPDDATRAKNIAVIKVNFVKDAVAALKYGDPKGSAANIAASISSLSLELSTATQSYATAAGGVADAGDSGFISTATKAMADLKKMMIEQKGILASKKVVFDANIQKTKHALADTQTALDLLSAAVSASSSATSSSGSLDVIV